MPLSAHPRLAHRLIWGLAAGGVNPGDPWLLNYCKAAQAKFMQATASELTTTVYGAWRVGVCGRCQYETGTIPAVCSTQ
jgi:hypothetical protein